VTVISETTTAAGKTTAKIEIGIVGGGIAGLYCAWKLAERKKGYRITVYESLDRVGGRIETIPQGQRIKRHRSKT
jgi:protoporphyrinogen oxidase